MCYREDQPHLLIQAILDETVENVIREKEISLDFTHLTAVEVFDKLGQNFDLQSEFSTFEKESEAVQEPIYLLPDPELQSLILGFQPEMFKSCAKPVFPNAPKVVRRMPLWNKKNCPEVLRKFEESLQNIKIPIENRKKPRSRKQTLRVLEERPKKKRATRKNDDFSVFEDPSDQESDSVEEVDFFPKTEEEVELSEDEILSGLGIDLNYRGKKRRKVDQNVSC